MKLVKTFGRGRVRAEAMIAALEQRGALNTSKVEKIVTAIVTDVRRRGDVGLRKYAEKFDGLKAGAALLWVRCRDPDTELAATRILDEAGGRHVHVHGRSAGDSESDQKA